MNTLRSYTVKDIGDIILSNIGDELDLIYEFNTEELAKAALRVSSLVELYDYIKNLEEGEDK